MRDRFPLLMVGGLALLAALSWFLLQGARRGSFADRLSTFRSEPDGARALFLLLSESGLPVSRQQQDLTVLPAERNLVLLGTRFRDELGDDKAAFDGSDAGVPASEEADEEEFKARGLNALRAPAVSREEQDKLLEHVRNGATLVFAPASHRDPKLLRELGVELVRTAASLDTRTLVPAQPSRYVHGVQRVVTRVRAFLVLPPGAVPLLVDNELDQPVAAVVPYGQGRVILLGAPELAMNRALGVADNARFWRSLLGTVAASGPVAFDEFHHGFTGQRSMGEFAARYGLQYAVAQLLLGVALWALALRRFGRPRPPEEELRVGSTDALFATSRLYRAGKHHAHAAASIARALAHELAEKAGVSGRLEPAEIGAALEVRGRKDLARALLDVSAAARTADDERDVQHVATLAAVVRKTLQHQPRTKR